MLNLFEHLIFDLEAETSSALHNINLKFETN